MSTFHAQPYGISARSSYFKTDPDFEARVSKETSQYGQPVEESGEVKRATVEMKKSGR